MDQPFIEGFRAFKPSDKAPEFIKANIVIDVVMLTNWLNENANAEGMVRLVIKESKAGKFYAEKDQYTAKPQEEKTVQMGVDDIPAEELPF